MSKKREFIIAGSILVVIAVLVITLVSIQKTDAQVIASLPAISAAQDTTVTVGPQENVQVSATSSRRMYLLLQRDDNVSEVYCSADQDNLAVVGEGVKIATSTENYFVWSYAAGNPIVSAVRCTAAASTTLSVVEYDRR